MDRFFDLFERFVKAMEFKNQIEADKELRLLESFQLRKAKLQAEEE